MRIKEVVNRFLDLELKYQLFNLKYKNYAIWPYFRMYFYYYYMQDKKILDYPVTHFKKNISYFFRVLKDFIKLIFIKKGEYLILESPRSINKKDIYTHDITKYLELKKGKKVQKLSFSHNGIITKGNDVIIIDIIKIFSKILSKLGIIFIKNYKFDNFRRFIIELNGDDNGNKIKRGINLYKRYYIEFLIQVKFYSLLLRKVKPQNVIVVSSYNNMPLIIAAKLRNIEVIEIQHGVISKYHLGYHYPYYETNFFPDKLFTFGEFWNNSAKFPLNCKVIPLGNNFLYTHKKNIYKRKNTILVISQATIGKRLARFITYNINDLEEFEIYFKLHPGEFNKYKEKYKDLINLNMNNLNIITKEFTINELQYFCEYQIGVYSTAIFEGIEKGCKTILVNIDGIEYMEQLIEENVAILVNIDDEIRQAIRNIKLPENIIFFEKINENILMELF